MIKQGQEDIPDLANGEISLRDEFISGHNFEMTFGSIETTLKPSNLTEFYLLIKATTEIPFLDIKYHQFTTKYHESDQVSSSGIISPV